jgi:hypothetical protein
MRFLPTILADLLPVLGLLPRSYIQATGWDGFIEAVQDFRLPEPALLVCRTGQVLVPVAGTRVEPGAAARRHARGRSAP